MPLAPSDAAVAARSFPRRWRTLFAAAAGDDDHPDLLARSGALGLADDAVGALTTLVERIPALVPRTGPPSGDEVLDRLAAASERAAAAIESVPSESWDSSSIAALTDGIDGVVALLRQAERAIDDARRAR